MSGEVDAHYRGVGQGGTECTKKSEKDAESHKGVRVSKRWWARREEMRENEEHGISFDVLNQT